MSEKNLNQNFLRQFLMLLLTVKHLTLLKTKLNDNSDFVKQSVIY